MTTFGSSNIYLNAVRASLGEDTGSLIALCHSPNINKWAKYSPLTRNGGKWTVPVTYRALPYQAIDPWEFVEPPHYTARLGDFRMYADDFIPPVSFIFPSKIVAGDNFLGMGIFDSPYHISIGDVHSEYNNNALYPCVCLDDMNGMYSWAAGFDLGHIDLTGYDLGKEVRVTYCLSDTEKVMSAPNVTARFYSLNFGEGVYPQKVLPFDSLEVTDPNNPEDVDFNIQSLYYPVGNTCNFKTVDGRLGIHFTLKDSSGATINTPYFDYFINEDGGNSLGSRASYNDASESYIDIRPGILVSAFSSMRQLSMTLMKDGSLYVKKQMQRGSEIG